MNITTDHWLEGVERVPYPAGPKLFPRYFAVVHFTDGATAKSSIDYWRTPAAGGAEAHVVIDRNGKIYQLRPFDQQCDHAGKSTWKNPKDGKTYTYLNHHSIGIELANGGYDDPELDAFDWAKKNVPGFQSVRLTHKNESVARNWEVYPAAQIAACKNVLKACKLRYNLDDIVGHDDIAPTRKTDPGPAFPMLEVREFCGFTGLPGRG